MGTIASITRSRTYSLTVTPFGVGLRLELIAYPVFYPDVQDGHCTPL